MRLGLEIELRRRAPAARFHIIFGALPHGHAGVRQIREGSQDFAQAGFLFSRLFFGLLNLLAQFLGFLDLRGSVLPASLELGNLLGSPVALSLQSFRGSDGLAALGVDGDEVFQDFRRIHSALPELFFYQREVVANKIQIEHCSLTLAEKRDSVHPDGVTGTCKNWVVPPGLASLLPLVPALKRWALSWFAPTGAELSCVSTSHVLL